MQDFPLDFYNLCEITWIFNLCETFNWIFLIFANFHDESPWIFIIFAKPSLRFI